MNKKICLITTTQVSVNPRLVKEASALLDAGFEVIIIFAYWCSWAARLDSGLINNEKCKLILVGGAPNNKPLLYLYTRVRSKIARSLLGINPFIDKFFMLKALSRATPELIQEALKIKADLYIAHNIGALPAAVIAAKKNKAKAGFDAEDFHSGENPKDYKHKMKVEYIEKKYLPKCSYVSASSELIASAYERKYGVNKPNVILNVFPVDLLQEVNNVSVPGLSLFWFSRTIGPGRGLEEIVQAMGRARKQIKLYLQGDISEAYKNKLLKIACDNRLDEDQLVFLSVSSPKDIAILASRYDVGLALEQKSSLNNDLAVSNKIFTYLLSGLSIIATETAGQKPIIDSIQGAGWSYKIGDIDSLAKRLIFLSENKDVLIASKREAIRQARKQYNWDLEKNKFLEIISNVLR